MVTVLAFLDPNGLSVGVMQSNNSFSVGGSLSVNCHGWQYNRPPIASTVEAFRLMKSDGSVVRCSREENKELFSLVLGGYGLFGIILEADLRTVPNRAYKLDRKVLPFGNAIPYYNEHLRNNRDIDMAYARLNIVPKKLFDDIIISAFRPIENAEPPLMRPLRRPLFVAPYSGSQQSRILEKNFAGMQSAVSNPSSNLIYSPVTNC